MPITKVNIEEFLQLSKMHLLIDVRSPNEYNQAHIPNAISLPLFTDDERKIIGTAYKLESKQQAVKHGLKYFGVNMVQMIETVEALIAKHQKKSEQGLANTVLIHCWRGGMRSAGVAWLLELYGFNVYTLVAGYKAYRHWVLKQFDKQYAITVLGGYTGSGKTPLLYQLKKLGQKIIDLEGLAFHKGSAFGGIDAKPQPSQEMFENQLATELHEINEEGKTIWVENESRRIGNLNIPSGFFKQLRERPVVFLNIPFEQRLEHILEEYGKFKKEELIATILRIKKRLGGLETKNAINYLLEDNVKDCFRILLSYYDKGYTKSTNDREEPEQLITTINVDTTNVLANAEKLMNYATR